MSYQVLARKWRPGNFTEMVGQAHVLRALINALDEQRLHHAYLFTGTRGVGKTTVARIFAKSLNCETGITSRPCGECSTCREIAEGRYIDLIEVDAASRTKVEDTRELLDNVQYAPTRGRFKVYLIDEVHMLSNHSFNALLKTLEEPPAHVKFLLATTDPQKLPPTILSRCLQFNLKRMPIDLISKQIQFILQQENVASDDAAIALIAHAADGSMRDALSLLDQAIAYGAGKLDVAEVQTMLGTVSRDQVLAIIKALLAQDAAAVMREVAALSELTPDYQDALADILSLLHQMALSQWAPDALTEQLVAREVLIDLGQGKNRLGASALAQVYGQVGNVVADLDDALRLKNFFAAVRQLAQEQKILAYHDRSDGGLLVTLAEMMFASRCGVTIYLDTLTYAEREADVDDYDVSNTAKKLGEADAVLAAMFNEELGAVIQIRKTDRAGVMQVLRDANLAACSHVIGHPNDSDELRVIRATKPLLAEKRVELQSAWSETSYLIQSLRDNPVTAKQEYDRVRNADDPGLNVRLTFDPSENISAPFIGKGAAPKIAILREQGVNGQLEMAHAFTQAGFAAFDVHMSDIISGRVSLADFKGFAACGGFSYGDVLGAGEGWAKSILFNARVRDEFAAFFQRSDSFALGVCNGCQMMSNLHEIIPGAENWPHLERNASEQYEARTVLVEIRESPSILFAGMAGSRLPVATAHGEGRAVFRDQAQQDAARWLCSANFVDNHGVATEQFPANPNGSPLGMTAFTTPDGRFTIMMPHPERVALNVNLSSRPSDWASHAADGKPAFSPWMRMFRNARRWVA